MSRSAAWPLAPSLDAVHATAVACLVFMLVAGLPIADPDLGWHLKAGEQVWQQGAAPTHDPFSYTLAERPAGNAWIAYSWLAEAVFWLVATRIGFHALIVLCAAILAATFVVVYRTCRDAGAAPAAAHGATLLAALASWLYTSQRPAMVSFLLAALFARALGRVRRGLPVRLWALVPLMALWANVHVFFVFALVWLWGAALWTLIERAPGRRGRWAALAATAVGCTAATLCTPYGTALLGHVASIAGQPASLAAIAEHGSPNFHEAAGLLVLPLLLALVAALAWSSERPDPFQLTLVLGHTALALYMRRNVPFLAILAAPLLARAGTVALGMRGLPALPARARALAHAAAMAAFLLLAAHGLPTAPDLASNLRPGAFPVAAVDFLEAQPPLGRMLNGYNWGGFLIYRLYPRYRVAMDSRSALYGETDTREYLQAHFADGNWQRWIERVDPDFVLWERGGALSAALAARPEWVRVYADEVAVIFVRADHPLRTRLEQAGREAHA